MDTSSAFNDYKLFIKKNRKLILGSTIALVIVMLFAVVFFVTRPEQQALPDEEYVTNEIFPQLEASQDVEELSTEEQELLTDYLNKDSYSFRIYVQNEDSTVFTDNVLLRQILTDDALVQRIREETGSEFLPIPNIAVTVFQISGSEVLQVRVGTGNKEYNQKIIDYYYQYISEGNIPVFEDKEVFFVDSEPFTFEEMYGVPEEEQQESLTFAQSIRSNIEVIIIVLVLGILAGLILGTFIAVIKESFSKRIPSIYNFELYSDDNIVNLDAIPSNMTSNMDAVVVQAIVATNERNKLVLSEKTLGKQLTNKLKQSVAEAGTQYQVNVTNLEDANLNNVEEIVVLVQVYETSKNWFEKQMEQTKALNTPVKVIRLPLNSDLFIES